MKDLFNSLKDQINPQSSSSSLGSLGGLLGSAAAGGILGALLGGSKSVKRTAKNIAYIGGGAAAASMAYSLYKKWADKNNSQGGMPQSQGHTYQPQPNTYSSASQTNVFDEFNRQNQTASAATVNDEHAVLLIEAMVFAARADGHIDNDEQNMILKTSKSLVSDERFNSIVREALQRPLDPAYIASKVPSPDMADDIYQLSATVIVADNYMEQSYLQGLARALNINDSQKLTLERQALEFRSQI